MEAETMPAPESSIEVMELKRAEIRFAVLLPLLASVAWAGTTETDTARKKDSEYAAQIAALKRSAPNAANLEKLGQNYFLLGDFKKSIDALEKAAKLDPSNATVQTWLGRAWGRRAESAFPITAPGYAGKARDAFMKALELNPSSPDTLSDLFMFYLQAPGLVGGGLEKATGLLPQLQKYDPVGYHLAKALIDEKNRNFDAAEMELRQAVAAGPGKIQPLIALGQFLSSRGRYEESDKVFAQARMDQPGAPRVLYAQAASEVKAKHNLDQARGLLKQYIASTDLTPNDPPRWQALKLLKKAEGS